ncbi:MAG: ribonuclease R [Rhizobiales bacterium]|nr:ribonuclease R [Hyphomicrobiales bacterium]
MARDGLIAGNRRRLRRPGRLAPVGVIEVIGRDRDGELIAVPAEWPPEDGPAPRILVEADSGRGGRSTRGAAPEVIGVGDRVLARLEPIARAGSETDGDGPGDSDDEDVDDGDDDADLGPDEAAAGPDEAGATDGPEPPSYVAHPIKRLQRLDRRLLGIFRANARGGEIMPVDRKQLRTWPVERGDTAGASDGDLVRFTIGARTRGGYERARIAETLGNPEAQQQVSLIAIHAHGIPEDFPAPAFAELERLPKITPKGREDLTALPLITIDPPDARDHDDAVWAGPDPDPANPDGHIVVVAIADVAFYVRPGSRLDRAALLRGNSVYFPDRVVPMLPELISNDLCSLREGELRPCLAVRMVFDARGRKRSHHFTRALMRSAAKLAYAEAQAAIDGGPAARHAGPMLETVLRPLWAAYRTIARARDQRAPLDLSLPERRIVIGPDGRVAAVVTPERLEAHRLIEEFMIQANVAAAEALEARRLPLVYRAHDAPSKEKLLALQDFLATLDISLPKGAELRPSDFNRVLATVAGREVEQLVNEVVLRAQSQAEYSARNYGHFGLNLARYAHFTSPIRRYADLIVHRGLIRALGLVADGDGLTDEEIEQLDEIAATTSQTERRAMAAERETADRLIAAFLADRVGATFQARISGLSRSGLFVRLTETGADGFVPGSSLMGDFYRHDEEHQALVGDRSNLAYRLGDTVEVKLVEAIASAGALRFEILSEPKPFSGRGLTGKRRGAGHAGRQRPGRTRSRPPAGRSSRRAR